MPEVVQTSTMDCGPAAMKALLEGFGIGASYSALRDACQTDLDGTSIDTLEELANELGLDAQQVMVPVEHVLLDEADALPCLAVMRLPTGATHFVVLWSRHGGWCQVMDPAVGRMWKRVSRVEQELYVHSMDVDADRWKAWASSDDFLLPLRRRLSALRISSAKQNALIDGAIATDLAALDAAVRWAESLRRRRGLASGAGAEAFVEAVARDHSLIPRQFWSATDGGEGVVRFRAAVLLRVSGRRDGEASSVSTSARVIRATAESSALMPLRLAFHAMAANAALLLALALAQTTILVAEAALFRGFFGASEHLMSQVERLRGMLGVWCLALAGCAIALPAAAGVARFGRTVELRIRMALLRKIPRLGDRYFQSRLTADLAERGHTVVLLRDLPRLGWVVGNLVLELILTTAALMWLDRDLVPLALTGLVCALVAPLAFQRALTERDLRLRTHGGVLARFYLDVMLGLTALRAHRAERAVRMQQEERLGDWCRSVVSFLRAGVAVETIQSVIGTAVCALMLIRHLRSGGDAGTSLLLVYWALNIPAISIALAGAMRQFPSYWNVARRLAEPLSAHEAEVAAESSAEGMTRGGAHIELRDVTVRSTGHIVLQGVSLEIAGGAHVAIVGESGAGKSTLLGLLLGWYAPAEGAVHVDGESLSAESIARLRQETAWIDPAVSLWNRTVLENLLYGGDAGAETHLPEIIARADLASVLSVLPDGLQSRLGESGGLLSGGQGQRLRIGRAMARRRARLVLLDEPFRGLERARRSEMLRRARALWQDATLILVSHDIAETEDLDHVIVLEEGKVVETGSPQDLKRESASRYSALLGRERHVRDALWSSAQWRRLRTEGGSIVEEAARS